MSSSQQRWAILRLRRPAWSWKSRIHQLLICGRYLRMCVGRPGTTCITLTSQAWNFTTKVSEKSRKITTQLIRDTKFLKTMSFWPSLTVSATTLTKKTSSCVSRTKLHRKVLSAHTAKWLTASRDKPMIFVGSPSTYRPTPNANKLKAIEWSEVVLGTSRSPLRKFCQKTMIAERMKSLYSRIWSQYTPSNRPGMIMTRVKFRPKLGEHQWMNFEYF